MISKRVYIWSLASFLILSLIHPSSSRADLFGSFLPPVPIGAFSTYPVTLKPAGSVVATSGKKARLGQKLRINGFAQNDSYATLLLQNPDGSLRKVTQNTFIEGGNWKQVAPSAGHSLYAVEPVGRTKILLILATRPIRLAEGFTKRHELERSLQQVPDFSYNIVQSYVDVVR